ncbi:oligosaccharide flippase family protein [Thiohalocapsa marina]|uniref:Oligosaccharide flippase family protein n=1 Tax=Thiohalocapsa marina TaxID=424902 RepID=A0A5M8FMK6_9GAMM|nr:oligosaccharide flippase family protein [Thiohalocapsa marina]KAA6186098.1 oligosaccharide flippase family protein [Thiohalocapsa marina]
MTDSAGMGHGNEYRSIARNTVHLVGAQTLARGLRILYLVALARLLGPELFALLSNAQFWQLLFLPLVVFGTGRLLSREIGRNPAAFSEILAATLTLRLALGFLVASAAALAGWWLTSDPAERSVLVLFSVALLARGVAGWTQQVFIASESSHLLLRQEIGWRAAEAVLGLATLVAEAGLLGVAAVHVLTWLLQAGSGLLVVHRQLHRVTFGWHRSQLRVLLQDGLSAMLVALALSVMLNGSLPVYLKLFPGHTDGGQLAVVLQALSVLLLLPKGIAKSTLPILGRQVAASAEHAGRTIVWLLVVSLSAAVVLVLLGMALASDVAVLLLGNAYAQAGAWLGPSLWLMLPFAGGHLLTQLLFAHGDVWASTTRAWVGALVTLIALWPLGAQMGALGVVNAIGIGLSVWAFALGQLAVSRGYIRIGPLT